MLTIRNEQMAVFRQEQWRTLLDEAVVLTCRHWKVTDDSSVRRRIEQWLQQGWTLGLRRRSDLLRLINVGMALGDDFLTNHGCAGAIVRNLRLSPTVRVRLLVEATADYLEGYEVTS